MSKLNAKHLSCMKKKTSCILVQVSHFLGSCMTLCLWSLHMMKFLHFQIIWVCWLFLLLPNTSTFCNINRHEVWVKGFFLLVPYEEYENPILHDDYMMSASHSLMWHNHPFLSIDVSLIHRCNYDVCMSHLKTHDFPCSSLSSFDVGGTLCNTWIRNI